MDIGNGEIFNDDCFNVMPKIANKSVDLVLCDLPYGCLHKRNVNTSWDSMLPMEPLWEQYRRIIKDNGAIVLFGQGKFSARLIMAAEDIFRYSLVWDKMRCTGFLNANRMPLRQHEDILVFYKKLPVYHPQMEELNGREPNHTQWHGNHKEVNRCYGNVKRINPTYTDKKFPGSIISIPQVHCAEGQTHPTQKCTAILRYLIRTYSNEGDTILDNCMGSGSTCVAAIKESRNYIGIEKERKYFDTAEKRIEKERVNHPQAKDSRACKSPG